MRVVVKDATTPLKTVEPGEIIETAQGMIGSVVRLGEGSEEVKGVIPYAYRHDRLSHSKDIYKLLIIDPCTEVKVLRGELKIETW